MKRPGANKKLSVPFPFRMHVFPLRKVFVPVMAALIAVILLGAKADFVYAHAHLVRSEPAGNSTLDAPPDDVRLWFSESPEARYSEIRLFDRGGQRVGAIGPLRQDPSDDRLLVSRLGPIPLG